MTEIFAGEYRTNELSRNAMGGTEQMALRMLSGVDPALLQQFHVIHGRVRELQDSGLKRVFVCHDLPDDPELDWMSDPQALKQYDKIVFVSHWQAEMFKLRFGLKPSQYVVIRNAIEPFFDSMNEMFDIFMKRNPDDPVKIVYHTTPHRGLAMFPCIIEAINKLNLNVEFHILSSFKVYGWEERDEAYAPIFEELKKFPNVTVYDGGRSNQEVRQILQTTDIFFYPSIWPETSCIAAMEALASGNMVVHSRTAALPETVGSGVLSAPYDFSENLQEHVDSAFQTLVAAVKTVKKHRGNPDYQAARAATVMGHNFEFDWHTRKHEWNILFSKILKKE